MDTLLQDNYRLINDYNKYYREIIISFTQFCQMEVSYKNCHLLSQPGHDFHETHKSHPEILSISYIRVCVLRIQVYIFITVQGIVSISTRLTDLKHAMDKIRMYIVVICLDIAWRKDLK